MTEYDDEMARQRYREGVWKAQDESFVQHEKANFAEVWNSGEENRLAELMILVQVGWDATRTDRLHEAWTAKLEKLQREAEARFERAWQRHSMPPTDTLDKK